MYHRFLADKYVVKNMSSLTPCQMAHCRKFNGSLNLYNLLSNKVLLELNEIELENGLGITHPMHRKKLVLAIEEHRHPSLVRYPCIGQLGHTWVSSEWLPDLGLAQVRFFTLNSGIHVT